MRDRSWREKERKGEREREGEREGEMFIKRKRDGYYIEK